MEYLAGPYSHVEPAIVALRYECHRQCAAELIKRGRVIYSPIVHGHNLLPELAHWRHREWLDYDLKILAKCSSVIVLMLDGWLESKGVKEELEFARERGLPVLHLNEGEYPL